MAWTKGDYGFLHASSERSTMWESPQLEGPRRLDVESCMVGAPVTNDAGAVLRSRWLLPDDCSWDCRSRPGIARPSLDREVSGGDADTVISERCAEGAAIDAVSPWPGYDSSETCERVSSGMRCVMSSSLSLFTTRGDGGARIVGVGNVDVVGEVGSGSSSTRCSSRACHWCRNGTPNV